MGGKLCCCVCGGGERGSGRPTSERRMVDVTMNAATPNNSPRTECPPAPYFSRVPSGRMWTGPNHYATLLLNATGHASGAEGSATFRSLDNEFDRVADDSITADMTNMHV